MVKYKVFVLGSRSSGFDTKLGYTSSLETKL